MEVIKTLNEQTVEDLVRSANVIVDCTRLIREFNKSNSIVPEVLISKLLSLMLSTCTKAHIEIDKLEGQIPDIVGGMYNQNNIRIAKQLKENKVYLDLKGLVGGE